MHAQCCPVCHGRTTVEANLYGEHSAQQVTCKSCKGQGYVLVPGSDAGQWHPVPYPQPTAPPWYPNPPYRITSGTVTCDKRIKTITINGGGEA